MYWRKFLGVFSFLGVWFGKGGAKPEQNVLQLGGMELAGDYELTLKREKELQALREQSFSSGSADVYG